MKTLLSFFGGLGMTLWGYIAAAGLGVFLLISAWFRGRRSMKAKINARTAEANSRMLDAAVHAPREKEDVVKDLRRGHF